MNYKYFIWDVGGTLFDTVTTSAKAFVKTFNEFGIIADEKEIYQHLRETTTNDTAAFFAPKDIVDKVIARYHEIETPMQENPEPFGETKEVLKRVVENGGKNYIVSNRDLQVVEFLEAVDVIQYFSYVITSNDHFPRKPDPTALEYLVSHFDVEKDKALMIGDREVDLLSGKNAGIKSVLYKTDDLVSEKDADFVIHHLLEAVEL
jgi:HAD superfamily hydrolase (TIGR01549 family)